MLSTSKLNIPTDILKEAGEKAKETYHSMSENDSARWAMAVETAANFICNRQYENAFVEARYKETLEKKQISIEKMQQALQNLIAATLRDQALTDDIIVSSKSLNEICIDRLKKLNAQAAVIVKLKECVKLMKECTEQK